MRRSLLLFFVVLSFVRPALPAAAEPAAPAAPTAPPTTVGQALAAVVTAAQADIDALNARVVAATDPAAALDLALQVEQAKRDLQRDMLEVQLAFARRDGRLQQVAEIEGALARMDAPAVEQPQPRPIPQSAPAAR